MTGSSIVKESFPIYKEGRFCVLIGDGVKQSKEGRRMPGVKKLFQESENSAKHEYIHGHMFGGLGILAGSVRQWACIPLSIHLHDGLKAAAGWEGACICASSHVVQMVKDAYRAACTLGDCLLLLDRYFFTIPALENWRLSTRMGIHAWRSSLKQRDPVLLLRSLPCVRLEEDVRLKKGLLSI